MRWIDIWRERDRDAEGYSDEGEKIEREGDRDDRKIGILGYWDISILGHRDIGI